MPGQASDKRADQASRRHAVGPDRRRALLLPWRVILDGGEASARWPPSRRRCSAPSAACSS